MQVKNRPTTNETRKIGVNLFIPKIGNFEAGDLSGILCRRGLTIRTTEVVPFPPNPSIVQSRVSSSTRSETQDSNRLKLDEFAVTASRIPFVKTRSNVWTPPGILQLLSRIRGNVTCVDDDGTIYFQTEEGMQLSFFR